LINEIYSFVPDDVTGERITKVVNQVLLSDEMILQKLAEKCPEILTDPTFANTCLKYVRLHATNDILFQTRNQFCDEMRDKKSVGVSYDTFKPVRKEDDKFYIAKIFFNRKSFTGFGIVATLFYTFEDLFVSELQQEYRKSNWALLNNFFKIGNEKRYLYCKDWKKWLPVLLSDTTNYLTKTDRYMMAQFPIWMEYIIIHTLQLVTHPKQSKNRHCVKEFNHELKRIKKMQMIT